MYVCVLCVSCGRIDRCFFIRFHSTNFFVLLPWAKTERVSRRGINVSVTPIKACWCKIEYLFFILWIVGKPKYGFTGGWDSDDDEKRGRLAHTIRNRDNNNAHEEKKYMTAFSYNSQLTIANNAYKHTDTRARPPARLCTHSQSYTPYVFVFFPGRAKSLTATKRIEKERERMRGKRQKRLKIRATACFWRKFETVRFLVL